MAYDNIIYEKQDNIAVITFNRPEAMNALNGRTLSELRTELAKLDAEDAGDLYLDKEGKKAFLLADRSWQSVEVESGKVKPVKLQATLELDAAGER